MHPKPIDAFAHVLAPEFYQKMLSVEPKLPDKMPYVNVPAMTNIDFRRENEIVSTQQIISMVNINPEDYTNSDEAYALCWQANIELDQMVKNNPDLFIGAVAMLPMNNPNGLQKILTEQIPKRKNLLGAQIFTRALGKSIADSDFTALFSTAAKLQLPLWLHPIFDERKPDNNIIFNWEYELSQAMLQLVQSGIYQQNPELTILVHHGGAMVPFFSERIKNILPVQQSCDFKKFYVDTAILGNSEALQLAISYFGIDHVLFGTDAPFGIPPVGANQQILTAIDNLLLHQTEKDQLVRGNAERLLLKNRV